jgi:dCTP deaminase
MILNDRQIKDAVAGEDGIRIQPFAEKRLQPASYDLSVGDLAVSSTQKRVVDLSKERMLTVDPGDYAVLQTLENLEFDRSHAGRFGLRSKYARKGVVASVGPQVDPGFRGKLVLSVMNLSGRRVTFYHCEPFLTLEVHELAQPAEESYEGDYQGCEGIMDMDIDAILDAESPPFSELTNRVGALGADVEALTKSIGKVEQAIQQYSARMQAFDERFKLLLWVVGFGFGVLSLLVALIALSSV